MVREPKLIVLRHLTPLLLPKHIRPQLYLEEGERGRRIGRVILPDGTEQVGDMGPDDGRPPLIIPGLGEVEWAEIQDIITAQRERHASREMTPWKEEQARKKPIEQWRQEVLALLEEKRRMRRRQSTFGYGGALIRQD